MANDGKDESLSMEKLATSLKENVAIDSEKKVSSTEASRYDRWTLKDEGRLDYGYFAATHGKGIESVVTSKDDGTLLNRSEATYYITTAINYTNGPAHMGHAYEATTSDVLARYHRLSGQHDAVYFLTGTDEHGQKIANTALELGKASPLEICDLYSTGFRVLNQRLVITNDDYLRTTSARHQRTAQELWKKCHEAGDIYLDTYTGWYNVKEETFVTDSDAQLWDYKDPASGMPLKKVNEDSYFFKMSKYQQRLIKYIEQDNPNFIQPEFHKNLILNRLKSDELRDLSISRTTFNWGIPVPDGFQPNHVMYVWMDALSNYLTGVDALGVTLETHKQGFHKFWPANVHIIGKDILWFHTVIWPTMLMSANLPIPKTVFAHGFVNDKDGKKMSKSVGNVVDPHEMLDIFSVDTFRWYLCKEAPYGGELSFSQQNMLDMHNADLCDNIGNLVNRATTLCGRFCPNGQIPEVPPPERSPLSNWPAICADYQAKMEAFELQGACQVAIKGFSDINGWLQEEAPWAKKGDEFAEYRQGIVRGALEAIYALAHLLLPVMPVSGKRIFEKLGTPPVTLRELNPELRNLAVGTLIETAGAVLYDKLLTEEEKKAASAKKKDDYAESKRKKQEAKAAQQQQQANKTDTDQPEFTRLDIRVGKIVKVWHHESAEKLFCEQIDVGEESGPREIASGLRGHYTLEEMQDRLVLVVCNLKSQKLVGFESHGMVLAAKSDHQVELVEPPAHCPVGERVTVSGLLGEPWGAAQIKKRKVWETVAADLKTGEGGLALYQGQPLETSVGPCRVPTLIGAPIS